jgi:hypothetical protein
MRRIEGEPIHLDERGTELRDEIKKRREGVEDSITEWRADNLDPAGEHEGHHTQLKRASESLYRARMAATQKQFEEFPGVTEERARVAAEAVATMPPVEVTPVGDEGRPIQRLRDDQPVREEDSFRNLAEAKRGMSQYRDWVAQQQVALLNELQAEENRQQVAAQEVSDQRAAEVRSYITPSEQPQQPDPVAQERAALQAERQATAQIRQLSEAERKLVENVNAWGSNSLSLANSRRPAALLASSTRDNLRWQQESVDFSIGLQRRKSGTNSHSKNGASTRH